MDAAARYLAAWMMEDPTRDPYAVGGRRVGSPGFAGNGQFFERVRVIGKRSLQKLRYSCQGQGTDQATLF